MFLVHFTSNGQSFNMGFEDNYYAQPLPDYWFEWGQGYIIKSDTTIKYSGKYSVSIEPKSDKQGNDFGAVAYVVNAPKTGNVIELSAYIKYKKIKKGYIGLILRIDDRDSVLYINDYEEQKIKGSSKWRKITIKTNFPSGAKKIYFAAISSGIGKLWVDEFSLKIDGELYSSTPPALALLDHSYDSSSRINDLYLNNNAVNDLYKLGKVWGFLKYYHPVATKGDINWDYELFRVLPSILKDSVENKCNEILLAWVDSLGIINSSGKIHVASENTALSPDFEWINDLFLGEQLKNKLNLIIENYSSENSYYVELDAGLGFATFYNENPYEYLKEVDAGYRLLSLFRYWNAMEYYFPYKNKIPVKWDNTLIEFIPIFLKPNDSLEYRINLLKLISKIGDSHASIYQDYILENYLGLNSAPFETSFIEGKLAVIRLIDSALCKTFNIQNGDVILSVNSIGVSDIVMSKTDLISASTSNTLLRDISDKIIRTNDSILVISFLRDNIETIKIVKCLPISSYKNYYSYEIQDTCFKFIDPQTAYINIGNLKVEHLPQIMTEVNKSKALIIDLRKYPKEFVLHYLMQYLLLKPSEFTKISCPNIDFPGEFLFTRNIETGDSNENYYKGKVVVLINENTQSQGEYTAMALQCIPGCILIGNYTAGADGNISGIYFPGGIYTFFTALGVFYPDGTETQKIGVKPNYIVLPTINGIQENRDELIEKALFYIYSN